MFSVLLVIKCNLSAGRIRLDANANVENWRALAVRVNYSWAWYDLGLTAKGW